MPDLDYVLPQVRSPHSTEDPKVRTALSNIKDLFNGNLDADNLAAGAVTATKVGDSLSAALGINNGSNAGRDYATVATSQSTTSSAYADLSTAGPSVTVEVPSDGWVDLYVQCSVTGPTTGSSLVGIYEATDFSSSLTVLLQLAGSSGTLRSAPGSSTGSSGVGGWITVPATAGERTYTLKYARFAGSGNATFADRKLWAIARGPMP